LSSVRDWTAGPGPNRPVDKHGYAILKDVKRRSDGAVGLNVGTLYAVLKRLEQDGLIAESDERPDPALDDERRRCYRITADGAAVARAEVRRMEGAVAMARSANLVPRIGRVRKADGRGIGSRLRVRFSETSEVHTQTELETRGPPTVPVIEIDAVEVVLRQSTVHSVEQIEDLPPELGAHPAIERNPLWRY
jgi:DNA-binding PadR family transcriptional regulator